MSFVITGSDALTVFGRFLRDLSTGDVGALEFENDLAALQTGKGGNSVIAIDEQGRQGTLTIRVLRGSSDDKFLMARLNDFLLFPPAFVLATGTLVKLIGNGAGGIKPDTYIMAGGIFTKIPAGKSNVNGDTEQGESIYTIKFANVKRQIF